MSLADELAELGLTQARFARLLGKGVSQVNRWCQPHQVNHVPAPRYALAFLAAFRALGPRQRKAVLAELEDA
ncbi:MAG: hypothetical protein E7K72_19310 [Roseomonas mucosa]|nr:hypothetical protein [Roseomonas mucosa]